MTKSFGHFSPDGREYHITDALAPPRAQINFLWNRNLISGVNQFGSGEGIFNDRTLLYNDPRGRVDAIRDGRRYFYIQDSDSGEVWNTGWFPTRVKAAVYQASVGLGYSKFEISHAKTTIASRVFLAPDEPVEIWEFTLQNESNRERTLRLVPYVEWLLLGYPTFSSKYSYYRSAYDRNHKAVCSYNTSDERPHERYNAFVATNGKVAGWAGSRRQFLGPYGSVSAPDAFKVDALCSQEAWCEDLAGALDIQVKLKPGKSRKITVLLGLFESEEDKSRIIKKVMTAGYRNQAFADLIAAKDEMIQKVRVETPNRRINILTNIWAKQQTQLCAEFGRDGARGFRDTLQDAWGMAMFNPSLSREKILETLSHQCADGHGIRGWMPVQPHHYSDGPVWIILTILAYLKETGDDSILDEEVKYFDSGSSDVTEHMLRALRHLSDDTGAHGLCHAHQGDWNDSLNWMGRDGIGESVWTSIGLYYSLDQYLDFLFHKHPRRKKLIAEMTERKERIESAIQKNGWDGEWYLAGWSDFGQPVGSRKNRQGKIFLNSQTWAVLSNLATGKRAEKCLKAVDLYLESDHGTLTLNPAFTEKDLNVGRVSMLLPGMYENGTPYCHGTAFKIVADLHAGRADEALASFLKVMPDSDNHPSYISGAEPYAYTNQYLGPENGRAGESLSGWITGTAGWMFRAVLEYFLGIQPDYDGFHIRPCLPSNWPEASAERTFRGKRYRILVRREGEDYALEVNGQPLAEPYVPYEQ